MIAEASKAQKKMVGAPVGNSNAKKQLDQNGPVVSKAERSRKKSVPNESGTNRYSRILVTGQNDLQLEMKPRDNITRKLIAKEQGITEMKENAIGAPQRPLSGAECRECMMKFKHKKKRRYLMIGAEALQRSLQNLSEICITELPNSIAGTFDNKMKESEESGNLEGGIDYGETD